MPVSTPSTTPVLGDMGCFFGLYLPNRPAIPPFGKLNFMDKTKEVLTNAVLELNLQAQKEAQEQAFKQDCRRTAINLSERFTRDADGGKSGDVSNIISNAEIIYTWLIDYGSPKYKNYIEGNNSLIVKH